MKFRLPAKELHYALVGLSKAISANTTLSILKGVRIEAEGKSVTLSATDLDGYVSYRCQNAEVLEKGVTIVADIKRLKTIVERAKKDEAEIRTISQGTIEVGLHGPLGGRVQVLSSLDVADWPAPPPRIKTEPVKETFLNHYRTLLPFTSNAPDRPTLGGVYCDITTEGHVMVSTDGRRLTSCNSIRIPISASIIIPRNKFLAWPLLEGDVEMGIDPNDPWCRIQCGAWDATIRLIERAFPNWRQVVPAVSGDTCFDLATEDVPVLEEAIRTLPGGNDATKAITLMASATHPKMAGRDTETSIWSSQVLLHSRWSGSAKAITVNRSFLLDAVKAGFRQFHIVDENTPLTARNAGDTHVLMPVRYRRRNFRNAEASDGAFS